MQSNLQAEVEYLVNIVIFGGISSAKRHFLFSSGNFAFRLLSIFTTLGYTLIMVLYPLSTSASKVISKKSSTSFIPTLKENKKVIKYALLLGSA